MVGDTGDYVRLLALVKKKVGSRIDEHHAAYVH